MRKALSEKSPVRASPPALTTRTSGLARWNASKTARRTWAVVVVASLGGMPKPAPAIMRIVVWPWLRAAQRARRAASALRMGGLYQK